MHRRQFHRHLVAAALGGPVLTVTDELLGCPARPKSLPIIDTHQHLWDLSKQKVPWLDNAKDVLRRSYTSADYEQATRGLNIVKAIYMEVAVPPEDHLAEVELITELCRRSDNPTVAAVVGGRPGSDSFAPYARKIATNPFVKGVRQVLHGGTPRGHCLEAPFVRSMQLLGELNLSFDVCLRVGELADAVELADRCPDTRFIIDHCGNADPKAFLPPAARHGRPGHDPDRWRRTMDTLGKRKHVHCKISGIVARVPQPDWNAEMLAPIVNHCLNAFGPDRVIFGSDWPVCLGGAKLAQWVHALREIVATRPVDQQRRLFSENAQRLYQLED